MERPVGRIMSTEVLYAGPQEPLEPVLRRMHEQRVRHLVVVDKEKLLDGVVPADAIVGILSNRDILQDLLDHPDEGVRADHMIVGDVMTHSPLFTTATNATLGDAALVMHTERISALPVIEDGFLVGMITSDDILGAISQTTFNPSHAG